MPQIIGHLGWLDTPLPVLAGWVVSRTDRLSHRASRAVAGGLAAVVAIGHLAAQLEAMGRYSTGPGTSALAWMWRPGWLAAVPDVALVVLMGGGGGSRGDPAAHVGAPPRRAQRTGRGDAGGVERPV